MNILAMLYSTIFLCLAMPELPQSTLDQLTVIRGGAESYVLQSEGIDAGLNTSSILATLYGVFRGLASWNEWAGGEDYILRKQYVMERTQLPEWLAQYSGDVLFWEIEYFGETLTFLTDKDGMLITDPERGKAVNVRVKDTLVQGARLYKQQNQNDLKNVPYVSTTDDKAIPPLQNLEKPYIQGKDFYFTVYVDSEPHLVKVENFQRVKIGFHKGGYGDNYFFNFVRENGVSGGIPNITVQGMYADQFQTMQGYIRTYWGDSPANSYSDSAGKSLLISYTNHSISACFPVYRTDGNYNCTWANRRAQIAGILGNQEVAGVGSVPYLLTKQVKIVEDMPVPEGGLSGVEISASSLDEITNAISEIEPEIDPQTGIEILPIPQEFPLPENLPLEEESPIPDGPVYPEFDFPIGDPEQVPESDPETAPTTEPTEINLPENAEEIPVPETLSVVNGLQNRFPFSIPWDIYHALANLSAERQTPHWEWTLNVNMPFSDEVFSYTFVLDLGFMAGTVGLFRNLFLLAFILGLAVYSYNKFFGGGA